MSVLYFGGILPHKKVCNKPSISSKHDFMGIGRDSRVSVNFDIRKIFITVILSSKVILLEMQILISCLIKVI